MHLVMSAALFLSSLRCPSPSFWSLNAPYIPITLPSSHFLLHHPTQLTRPSSPPLQLTSAKPYSRLLTTQPCATINSPKPSQALDLVSSLALIHHFPEHHVRELGAQQVTSQTPQKAPRMPSSKTRHHSNPHAIDPKPNRRNSQRRVTRFRPQASPASSSLTPVT